MGYFSFLLGHSYAWKDSQRLVLILRAMPNENFLYKKINNKDLYTDYRATENTPEDACSSREYGYLTALK